MKRRLFISKEFSDLKRLPDYLSSEGIDLTAHSFLSFESKSFKLPSDFDVLFFGSPRAVKFFLAQHVIPENKQIGVVGQSTAQKLITKGYCADFIGSGGEIEKVAKEFKKWCSNRKVLFPISNLSLRTVPSVFEEELKTEITIYDTIIKKEVMPVADVYVFTSPSNIEGFLLMNQLPDNAIIICWGESSSNKLKERNVEPDFTLDHPSELALCQLLDQIF